MKGTFFADRKLTSYVVSKAGVDSVCGQCSRPASVTLTLYFGSEEKLELHLCKGHAVILAGYISFNNRG